MTKAKQVIRILVADDHAIFREGLRKLLDAAEEIQIVGEASNGSGVHQDAGEVQAGHLAA